MTWKQKRVLGWTMQIAGLATMAWGIHLRERDKHIVTH